MPNIEVMIETAGGEAGEGLAPFEGLERANVEALRYRGEDVARSLTRTVVKEARAKELRAELMNSARLAAHFEAGCLPRQLHILGQTRSKRPNLSFYRRTRGTWRCSSTTSPSRARGRRPT